MIPNVPNPARGGAAGSGRHQKRLASDSSWLPSPAHHAQAQFAPPAVCIIGIDPGLSGGVAFYFPEAPDRVLAEDMPVASGMVDCATLAARIRQMAPGLAIVERVASMPKQGVSSTSKFGTAYGAVFGVLAALEIRTSLVTPRVWKKHFRLDVDKEKGRALALRTFAKTPEHFGRKKDHGRAEAALLALYGATMEGKP
jgi:crossover junction endodeoxyribonuclease RuvC